jgi:hypothetical protein
MGGDRCLQRCQRLQHLLQHACRIGCAACSSQRLQHVLLRAHCVAQLCAPAAVADHDSAAK